MTAYVGTTGNDTWANIHAGDTVDGLAGDDSVAIDLSTETRNIAYNAVAAATATGNIPVTGMRIRNVEHLSELKTGSGADTLTISLAQGAFTWFAGTGTDKLVLDYSADTSGFSVYASGGGYYISGPGSQVTGVELLAITGGSGNDEFDDIHAKSVIDGGAGIDILRLDLSTATANIVFNAVIAGTSTGVTLADGTSIKNIERFTSFATGSGDDTFTISLKQEAFDWQSGAGNDRLVFDGTTATTGFSAYVSGGDYYVSANGSYAHDIASVAISGGAGADELSGTSGDDLLKGFGGNDTLNGLEGVNTIDGGTGSDLVNVDLSGATADILYDALAAASSTGLTLTGGTTIKAVERLGELKTGTGNDTLTLTYAQGAFTWYAADGTDRLNADYTGATAGFSAYVSGNSYYISSNGSTAYDVESVSMTGGAGADDISGTDKDDTLKGGAGNDTLDGLKGISTIDGGAGVDLVSLDLGDATAAIIYDATAAASSTGLALADGSTVRLTEMLGTLTTGSGNDVLTVSLIRGAFTWFAGDGVDRLTASYTADTAGFSAYVSGDSYYISANGATAYNIENVSISGGSGNDDISGTASDDMLYGGGGNDRLDGLTGISQLDGGLGDDTASLDLSAYAGALAYNAIYAATSTGTLLADGSRVRNAEHLGELRTGSGNDTLTIGAAQGTFTWYAGDGADRLVADYGADTVGFSSYVSGDSYYISSTSGTAYNIESVAIVGGSGGDDISGTAGDDTIDGGGGNIGDILTGGDGIDTLSYDWSTGAVTVSLALQGGFQNTVASGSDYATGFENLTGSDFADTLTGNSGANAIDGGLGNDTMKGGAGNDTYYVNSSSDVVIETAGGGIDTVISISNFNGSGQDIEKITLTGNFNVSATGNTLDNTIIGNAYNNTLNGGTGADTLSGGLGNDTYVVDNIGDSILEKSGSGTGSDTVGTTISWTLGENLENLVLLGTKAINGTGNALLNSLTGNSAANLLDGGAGADTMTGGSGDDTYVVDGFGDKVVEAADGGHDVVWSSVSAILAANVEDLILTGSAGSQGTGNDLDNYLTGNSGANKLDGGIGHDTMFGGAGDDVYVIDHVGDVIIELAGGGDDTVVAYYDYVLPDEVENIILTGSTPTTAYGNDLANVISGNGNNNLLRGLGGLDTIYGYDGNDTLRGGAATDKLYGGLGNDTFVFDAAGAFNGVDRIEDFASGTDVLLFGAADYGIAAGTHLSASQFFYGSAAVGAGAQFFYNTTSHILYYDSNGAGGAAPIAIAVFDNGASPVAADFVFI